jgi:Protein of unknown function (DUF669)
VPEFKADFSETESRGGKKGRGSRKHYPEGDYPVISTKAELGKSREKETPGIHMVYKITNGTHKGQEVHDDLWLTPGSMWKVRQTLEAMGMKVPSKAVKVNTDKMVRKELAITLADEEYDDKLYSKVVDYFLISELDQSEEADDEGDDTTAPTEDDEDEDADVEAPKAADDDIEDLDLDDL